VSWMTDESYFEQGQVTGLFRYYQYDQSVTPTPVFPTCVPTVTSIRPAAEVFTNSWIHIIGDYLGLDADKITISVSGGTSFGCKNLEMVVSNKVFRCIVTGGGNNRNVNITVNKVPIAAPIPKISFSRNPCRRICGGTSFPDGLCTTCQCIKPTVVGIDIIELGKNIYQFMELTQTSLRVNFEIAAHRYRGNDLELLDIPRYSVQTAFFNMSLAVIQKEPLLVSALTNDVKNSNEILQAFMTFDMVKYRWEIKMLDGTLYQSIDSPYATL